MRVITTTMMTVYAITYNQALTLHRISSEQEYFLQTTAELHTHFTSRCLRSEDARLCNNCHFSHPSTLNTLWWRCCLVHMEHIRFEIVQLHQVGPWVLTLLLFPLNWQAEYRYIIWVGRSQRTLQFHLQKWVGKYTHIAQIHEYLVMYFHLRSMQLSSVCYTATTHRSHNYLH